MSGQQYHYAMLLCLMPYYYAVAPEALLVDGYDRATRDILRCIAPDILAKLASATKDEQVQVSIRVEVRRRPLMPSLDAANL